MAVSAQNIRVEITAGSTELQAAVAKAAEALKGLAETVAQSTRSSLESGKQSLQMNYDIAASYQRTMEAAKSSGLQVVESVRAQAAAAKQAATQVTGAQAEQQAALERTGAAAQASAEKVVEGATASTEAVTRFSQAASAAGDIAAAAAAKTGASMERQAAAAGRAAASQAAAVGASADEQAAAYAKAADAARASAIKSQAAQDKSVAAFGAKGSQLTKMGKTIALSLSGAAAASAVLAIRFEKNMTLLQTQAGASSKQVKQLSQDILSMAPTVGATPDQLAQGMYHVVSAMNATIRPAERVKQEMEILRQSAMGAAIGHSNLEQTTYALTSAMNALHEPGTHAGKVMAELNAIVGAGDLRMEELVGALGTGIIPAARTFGISIQSVGAALDTMTQEGTPAQMSATRLRMAISLLGAPSATAAKKLEAIGLASGEVHARTKAMSEALESAKLTTTKLAEDMKQPNGIMVALEDLKRHFEEAGLESKTQAAFITRAFGGGRMGTSILQLYQRLPAMQENYNNQLKITGQYSHDWQRTQETLSFQWDELKGKAAQVGTEIGTKLVPGLEKVISDTQEVWEWLSKNHTEARAIEVAFGSFAALAMSSALFSRVKDIGKVFSEIYGVGKLSATSIFKGTSAGSLVGSRGPIGAGSIMNPITVAIEAGQYAGLGSMGAQGTVASETKAAAAESGAAASAASSDIATAETAVGGVGVASMIRSSLGSILSNALKGGMIAGGGMLASQAAGYVIGGPTGHDVASYGKAAAEGAGAGTLVLGPGAGTAIGGAVGLAIEGLLKTFTHGTQGAHAAETAGKGASPAVQDSLASAIDHANKVANAAIYKLEHEHEGFSGEVAHFLYEHTGGIVANAPRESVAAKQAMEKQMAEEHKRAEFYSAGKQFGASRFKEQVASTQGMSPVAQLTGIIKDSEARLADLPKAAKMGAYEAILEMVKEFQKDGKLPPTSVEELVRAMQAKFPALKQAFSSAGGESVAALNQALKGQATLTGLEGLINQWRSVMPELPHIVGLNLTNAEQEFGRVNAKLTALAHSGPESQRDAMSELYKKVRDQEIKYFSEMRQGIEGEVKHLQLKAPNTSAMETAYRRLIAVIRSEMGAGVKATSKGTNEINRILNGELEMLGISAPSKKDQSFGPMPGGGSNALQQTGTGGSSGFTGFAEGGLVQLGRAGERGHDSIPLNAGGVPIVAAPGEQVAVFTHQQQAVANQMLAPIGGLPGLFSSYSTPHYMAQGGMVGGGVAAMIAEANKINAKHYPYVWGGGHNPQFAGPYDCSGSVSAVLHAAGLLGRPETSGELMSFGQPGPGPVTLYASPAHVWQLTLPRCSALCSRSCLLSEFRYRHT